ncbi:hypothetical protein ACFGVS_01050 [Mucilaginibacter sp. AW1-7]|uniref:hypothetical protein n=1 Tax=Mucilaginibacter sp. AW1-7 TaxID=3349874 RepID=UPI003F73E600
MKINAWADIREGAVRQATHHSYGQGDSVSALWQLLTECLPNGRLIAIKPTAQTHR